MAASGRQWQPANDAERQMLRAIAAGDQTGYFAVLAGTRLYLPGKRPDLSGNGPDLAGNRPSGERQQLATWQRDSVTYLLAFTSLEALAHCLDGRADAYWTTDHAELVRRWPDPAWKLAINPTVPIGAFLAVDDVAAGAAGELTIPTIDDLATQATGAAASGPANDLERALDAARNVADTESFLDVLVTSQVLLAVTDPALDPAAIRRPDFPWPVDRTDGIPTIAVFTSPVRLTEAHRTDVAFVTVDFVAVTLAWPDPAYRLSVNPGNGLSIDFVGDEIGELNDWARELAYRRPPPDTTDPDGGNLFVEMVVFEDAIDRYLREGQTRATGLVGPAGGVRADKAVHVLRWRACCPELYQEAPDGLLIVADVAMPHGARLIQVAPSGTETVVATFDADVGGWATEPPDAPPPDASPPDAIEIDAVEIDAVEIDGHPVTVRDGYVARWRDQEYEASPDGALIRLYAPTVTPGFRPVGTRRHVRLISGEEAGWFGYRRTEAVWRGQPVTVLAERGDRCLVSSVDEQAPEGLRRDWVPQADLGQLSEIRFAAS
jgi:hypothetical protein